MANSNDDAEDDYMSDSILLQCPEIRPGLIYNKAIKRQNEKDVKHARANEISRTKSKTQLENEKRAEGLKCALESNNKGFSILQKMGYKPGTSLGKREKGLVEPIPINVKNDRKGLGREAFIQNRIDEVKQRRLSKKIKLDSNFEHEYRQKMKNKFTEKQIKSDVTKCQKVCEQLDQEMGIDKPAEPWFWISNVIKKNEDDESSSSDSDEEEPEFEPSEMLEILTSYLRKIHKYCIWCGTSYNDDDDLESNCPGNSHEEH